MLLVDRDETESAERCCFLHERVCPNRKHGFGPSELVGGLSSGAGAQASSNQHWLEPKGRQELLESSSVLFSEQLGRRHDRRLIAIFHRE